MMMPKSFEALFLLSIIIPLLNSPSSSPPCPAAPPRTLFLLSPLCQLKTAAKSHLPALCVEVAAMTRFWCSGAWGRSSGELVLLPLRPHNLAGVLTRVQAGACTRGLSNRMPFSRTVLAGAVYFNSSAGSSQRWHGSLRDPGSQELCSFVSCSVQVGDARD